MKPPTACPRCGGVVFRDYEDWWCLACGPLAPDIEPARRAELMNEIEPWKRRARHVIGGKSV